MDALIYFAYVSNPQYGETMKNTTMEDWFIVKDPIRAYVDEMGPNLDGNVLDLELSDRLEFSKLAMSIGSKTANNGSCELFEANMSEF